MNNFSHHRTSDPAANHDPADVAAPDISVIYRQCLGPGFARTDDYAQRAEDLMSGILHLPPHPQWKSSSLTAWDANPFGSRNWQFQHHALRWLSPARHLAADGNENARKFWLTTVRSWIDHNPPGNPLSKFSWIDMADGLRAQELVFGWPLATSEPDRKMLWSALDTHGEWLADETHQATGNHALHQNVGLFVLASFLGNAEWQNLAISRLEALFTTSFDSTGANDEGSIDYHRMNLSWWRTTWDRVSAEGVAVPVHAKDTLSRAATFLAHATRPNGTMVPLGDTHLRRVEANGWPELEYVASAGRQGHPSAITAVAAPNGYVLGRSGWGTPERPFSEQSHYSLRYGGHQSSHQHEDRGSITFFSGGQDWITDPGAYLYEPQDQFRKYLRSREAHNVVVIGEREYSQSSRVWLKSCHTDEVAHDFTVVDPNYSGVELVRRVVYLPVLDLLVVLDRVTADTSVTARQLWHTEPGIKPRYRDSALELQRRDGASMTINWLGQGGRPRVHYGDAHSVRDWVSRHWGKKEPAAGFEVQQTSRAPFFAAIMGDSTDDAWSVASSRAKPDGTWLRIVRFGQVWDISIDSEGVRASMDQEFTATNPRSENASAAAGAMESAVLHQRMAHLEQQWTMVSARAAESRSAVAELHDRLESANRITRTLERTVSEEREREKHRTAGLLSMLPEGIDVHALLGGLTLAEIAPYIDNPLFLYEIWTTHGDQVRLNLSQRRRLARELYQRGYLVRSLEVIRGLAATTGKDKDQRVAEFRASELTMMRGTVELHAPTVTDFHSCTGRILHVVGKAIPETQTGYTLRTHYLARAQAMQGYDVHVMRQAGGTKEPSDENIVDLQNVTYHLPDGPERGSVTWEQWLQTNTDALFELVGSIRPSILHCHSDFINQVIAKPVAEAYGIPLLYESRGFWEESWLSRVETTAGRSLEQDYTRYGFPEAYSLRQEREDQARAESDHVSTLAEVMKRHIVNRGVTEDRVTVAPNGVQPADFPVTEVNTDLKKQLGIPTDTPVIGYVTSMVEYEGIDTLISAFSRLRQAGEDAWLLLVGDGPVRKSLQQLARTLGVAARTIFTGRVSHEQILDYYSVIDVFVVPRKDRTVCRLVTPLKPFEAFCSGRAVVLSDVGALQEIADDSQAAETFEAGNPESLADRLRTLLHDDALRLQLSKRGAEWARNERSWEGIAMRYAAPYRTLGVELFTTLVQAPSQVPDLAEAAQRRRAMTISGRSEAISLLQLHGEGGIPTSERAAAQTVREGWAAYGFEPVLLSLPVEWRHLGPDDRSWQMHFHCWEFMHAPLVQWAITGEESYLTWCIDLASSWAHEFTDIHDDSTMAWYDMAIAYRTMVIITLLRAAVVSPTVTDEQYRQLLELALRHRDAHWLESSFNPRNNHGYYSALSQIVLGQELAELPGMGALRYQGEHRLLLMTRGQFMSDGGHSEHSPDYHRMLLEGFDAALAAGLINDPKVSRVIARAARALGWMIQPDGCLVQFGDSAQRQMVGKSVTSSSETTRWILSAGREGRPATETSLTLPETGYVFVREPAPTTFEDFAASSYLAFTSAFHSRAHKHCDDNTMVWFEAGQPILIDGGRYRYGELLPQNSPLRDAGFYYADPVRQFMETCGPHSTVSLDSPLHDRRRAPHGSGLMSSARQADGTYVITGSTPHVGWKHHRNIEFVPAQSLRVTDEVLCADEEEHDAFLWWHFDGSLKLVRSRETELVFSSHRWPHHKLHVTFDVPLELRILRGSEDPMGGWTSRKDRVKEVSWSVRGQARISSTWAVSTLMNFHNYSE